MRNFAVASILTCAISGCTDPVVVVESDFCTLYSPVRLQDYDPRTIPTIGADGWPSSTIVTERDARAIYQPNALWERRCGTRDSTD